MNQIVDTRDVALYEAYDNRYVRREARFGVERRALDKAPVIDVAPFVSDGPLADRQRVAAEIRRACIDIGFFYIRGHGVPLADFAELDRVGRAFFNLPFEEKMKTHAGKSAAERGFISSGGVDPDKITGKFPDIKERFMMSRETLPGEPVSRKAGSSQWPDEAAAPGFRTFMQRHIRDRDRKSTRLNSSHT